MRPLIAGIIAAVLTSAVAVGITITIMVLTRSECEVFSDANLTTLPPPPADESDIYRPRYHYTPQKNWVNDPNGLLYYKGEYHLFYQYDMDSTSHQDMSWGHAVSTDLVHWEEVSVAIPADSEEQIFSGCVVVDDDCTSGLCEEGGPPALVAVYTSWNKTTVPWNGLPDQHIQSQHIASSLDLGRTWTKYEKNPVLDINLPEFRDPKVIRKESGEWIMLVQKSDEHYLMFYESRNLLDWKEIGQFPEQGQSAGSVGGVWECPDMFEARVDDRVEMKKTVLIVNINPGNPNGGSAAQYFIGSFDGTKFISDDSRTRWLDYGMDYYATILWTNAPKNRRLSIGWMSNWLYAEKTPTAEWGWRNSFSSPRELKLRTINGEVKLTQWPVDFLSTLRLRPVIYGDKKKISNAEYNGEEAIRGRAVDIEVTFINIDAEEFGLRVHVGDQQATIIGCDVVRGEIFVDRSKSGNVGFSDVFAGGRHSATFNLEGDEVRLRVLVDHNSVEVFGGLGEVTITDLVYPDPEGDRIVFYATNGSVLVKEYSIWHMKSYKS